VDGAWTFTASLPWCVVRPVTDDYLEKEGTTKEAGANMGVLAKIQAGWDSVTLRVFLCRKLVRA